MLNLTTRRISLDITKSAQIQSAPLSPGNVPTLQYLMPRIKVEPTEEHPIPYNEEDETSNSFLEQVAVLANTAELQVDLGAPLEVTEDIAEREKQLLEAAIRSKKIESFQTPNTAIAAAGFLRTYGSQLALDVAAARAAITNKLMEIADCGDPKFELKALELLGKHSDIGLFTSRSEVTVNYKNPEDLENAIKERVKRLLNADVIDVTPLDTDLDEELGVAGEEYDPEGEDEEYSEEYQEGEGIDATPEE